MKLTTRLAAGALLATVVAMPATAEAKPVSKARTEAVKADRSLDRVVSLANRNRDTAAARELRKVRPPPAQRRRTGPPAVQLGRERRRGKELRQFGACGRRCCQSVR